ncbi:MAG: hypothetical protein L0Z62_24510, partial [Gemmataceae bacterium]|nr:hypothetical protein [Gemmataceae bacterium]
MTTTGVLRDQHGTFERFSIAPARQRSVTFLAERGFDEQAGATEWRQWLTALGADPAKLEQLPADQLEALAMMLRMVGLMPAPGEEPPAEGRGQRQGLGGGAGRMQAQEPFAERIEVARVERFFEEHRDHFGRMGQTKESFVLGFRNLV